MKSRDLPGRGLHFLVLLAAAGWVAWLPGLRILPGASFAVLAILAHAFARLAGTGKGLLFLETLPFFAYAAAFPGRLDGLPAFLTVSSAAAAGAAILLGERLAVGGRATFTSSAGFLLASVAAGAGLQLVRPWTFLGLTLLVVTVLGYGWVRGGRP